MRAFRHLLFMLGSFSTAVFGCVCDDHPPVPESLDQAAAVFSGRVVELKIVTRVEDGRERSVLQCVFDKVDAIKGVSGGSGPTFQIITDLPSLRCGYPFAIGEHYLVYAYAERDELWTSMCQRTKPLRVFIRDPFNPSIPRFADEAVDDAGEKERDLLKATKTANQMPEPTAGSVTPAADAPVAPPPPVAHR